MSKYNPKEFVSKLQQKMNGTEIPNCPYCGGQNFTSTDKFATIIIGDDLGSVTIGTSIPSGLLACENCGHIEFFALGALGLLKGAEDTRDGK